MARRAYIVLRRNDLEDNFLQALDLIPNESQRLPNQQTYGQTHYLSHYLLDGVNNPVTLTGAGPITVTADTYGLSGYLVDRVENSGTVNDPALTVLQATGIASRIEGIASAGTALDATAVDAAINAEAGVTGAGLAVGNSSGSVEEILRMLAGERFLLPAGEVVADATPTYVPINPGVTRDGGYFVTAPNVQQPTTTGPGGRKSTDRVLPEVLPVQTPPEDVNFVFLRHIYDTGDLHRSALLGVLSELKDPTFSFINSSFTYGTGGTALLLDGTTAIGTDGQAAAVQVYAADGTVI
jgi:hypothetical protein